MTRTQTLSLMAASLLGGLLLAGCGAHSSIGSSAVAAQTVATPGTLSGKLYGGPNPVVNSTITLYTTGNNYGSGATAVATGSTNSEGYFNLTLPTNAPICTAGQYLYITSYAGNTGNMGNNLSSLLMDPIGACTSNYTITSVTDPVTSVTTYTNSYIGPSLWINEITTALSAYAFSGFMNVTGSTVNIGADSTNVATYSATVGSASAGGLAHAFANAASLFNNSTGQPYGNFGNKAGYAVIPDSEIFLLGDILQACVNSPGSTGTNTATGNDGTACGMIFSLTTPPTPGATTPKNTLAALLNLAHFPVLTGTTWNDSCTASTGGSNSANYCLWNVATPIGFYAGALTAAPPDWSLAVVWPSGYGANTTAAACTTAGTCPGLSYPWYVALDYQDNVYVLNYDAYNTSVTPNVAKTWVNIVGLGSDGTPLFASAKDTNDLLTRVIATDSAGHVLAPNTNTTGGTDTTNGKDEILVYSTANGSVATSLVYSSTYNIGSQPQGIVADPFNNFYVASYGSGVNLRKFVNTGTASAPVYTVGSVTTTAPTVGVIQLAIDSLYDVWELGMSGSSAGPIPYMLPNTNTSLTSAPTYPSAAKTVSPAISSGSTTNAYGIGVTSADNAYIVDSIGATLIQKSGTGSSSTVATGSTTALPIVFNSTNYNRYLSVDGNDWVYTPDGANGQAVSGVVIFDTTDNLSLGVIKGCYVINKACGTTASTAPVYSPRSAALDSAGDIWVVSGASADLAEFIGAAAPTWPGLSLAKSGRP